MKKIELHLHFDGSINVEYTNKLLGYDATDELIDTTSRDLGEYLKKFELPIKLLQDLNNIEEYAYLLGKELERDEVIYAEVRFCPLFHVEKYSIDEVVEAIRRGFKRVSTVKVNLIFCMMRHFSVQDNYKIIMLTKRFLGNGVVGIDLAGDEAKYATEKFKELFDIIRKEGTPFTIHAGISSIQSDEVVNKLIRMGVTLEICPSSNIDTDVIKSIESHPIKQLVDNGVLVTINTDNRTVSNTNLNKEYELLRKTFGFSDEDFLKFNLNAINCAFIGEDEKRLLREEILS